MSNPIATNEDLTAPIEINLVDDSNNVYQRFIGKYGLSDEYFHMGQVDMEQRAQRHDAEGGERTQAARSAYQCISSKDYLRENQLKFLNKAVNEMMKLQLELRNTPSEVLINQLNNKADFVMQCEESLAMAESEFQGAMDVYKTQFPHYKTMQEKRQSAVSNQNRTNEGVAEMLAEYGITS